MEGAETVLFKELINYIKITSEETTTNNKQKQNSLEEKNVEKSNENNDLKITKINDLKIEKNIQNINNNHNNNKTVSELNLKDKNFVPKLNLNTINLNDVNVNASIPPPLPNKPKGVSFYTHLKKKPSSDLENSLLLSPRYKRVPNDSISKKKDDDD